MIFCYCSFIEQHCSILLVQFNFTLSYCLLEQICLASTYPCADMLTYHFPVLLSFSWAARSLHACWAVWQIPPSGPWGPRTSLYPYQSLQHGQADHHSVCIAMDDHHVWGEGDPAGDGNCSKTRLTDLVVGDSVPCCRKINNMVVPFKQTSESRGFLWVKNQLLLPEVLCCLVDVIWSADVYRSWKSAEIFNMFSAHRFVVWWIQDLFE